MSDAFDIKSKLSKLKPRTDVTPTTAEDESRLDAAAQRHEFVSREGGGRVKRQRSSEPFDMVTVKGPVSVINRFKTYTNSEHGSYWKAIDTLLKKSGY